MEVLFMVIDVHIYDCYQYTYKKYYKDVVNRCLQCNGIALTSFDTINKIIDVTQTVKGSKDNIQAKRKYCSRTIKYALMVFCDLLLGCQILIMMKINALKVENMNMESLIITQILL